MVYESDPVYFDTNEGNPNGAIGADQWVTVEIPLADFGAIDPSTVVGVMLYTNDHEVVTDEDGNPLNADGNPVAEGEEPHSAVASREEIYVELYFAGTPDARGLRGRRLTHRPTWSQCIATTTLPASKHGWYLTQATYAPETVGGGTVASTRRSGDRDRPSALSCRPADQTPKLHFDIWRSPTDQDAD